jgi:CysZ protein
MLTALVLAFRQLPEPEMRRPLAVSIGWTAIAWGIGLTTVLALQALVGAVSVVDVKSLGHAVAGYTSVMMVVFPTAVFFLLGFFSEAIISAVERRHYPALPPAPGAGWLTAMASSIRMAGVSLAVNLLALILVGFVADDLPAGEVLVYALANGYLVGRGYFETVALRRFGRAQARIIWHDHWVDFTLPGVAVAGLFLVPVANLVAPMVGLAATIHLIERLRHTIVVPARA